MIYIERKGCCPAAWVTPRQIARIVDLHKATPRLGTTGFYCVGGSDPDDGPTHSVEDVLGHHHLVTVYGPTWLQSLDVEDWDDWVTAIDEREQAR